jgi:hypothetical protein
MSHCHTATPSCCHLSMTAAPLGSTLSPLWLTSHMPILGPDCVLPLKACLQPFGREAATSLSGFEF